MRSRTVLLIKGLLFFFFQFQSAWSKALGYPTRRGEAGEVTLVTPSTRYYPSVVHVGKRATQISANGKTTFVLTEFTKKDQIQSDGLSDCSQILQINIQNEDVESNLS